jgi:hypothetical protein
MFIFLPTPKFPFKTVMLQPIEDAANCTKMEYGLIELTNATQLLGVTPISANLFMHFSVHF